MFGTSRNTADFVADALEHWWCERNAVHPGIRRWQIDLDNGPEIASSRTQFLKRLVEFAQREHLEIELVYAPPYHSKYNPIERCWGDPGEPLERHAADDHPHRVGLGCDDDLAGLATIYAFTGEPTNAA